MKRSYVAYGGFAVVALLGYYLIFGRRSSSSSSSPTGAPADTAGEGAGINSYGVPTTGAPADFTPVGSTPKSVPATPAQPTTTTTATDAAPATPSLRDRLLSDKGWDFGSYTIRGWAFVPTRGGWIGQPAHSVPGSTYAGDAQGSAPTTEEWTAFIRTGASQGWADKLKNLIPQNTLLNGEAQYLPPELLGSPSKANG